MLAFKRYQIFLLLYVLISTNVVVYTGLLSYVGVPSTPVLTINDTNLYSGETVVLTCASSTNTVPRNHTLTMLYTWTIGGVENATGIRYTYSSTRHMLTISDVRKADGTQRIACAAREDVGNGYTSAQSSQITLNVQCKIKKILLPCFYA